MKRLIALILAAITMLTLCSCDMDSFLSTLDVPPNESEAIPLSFVAELYDNHGIAWMAVEGSSLILSPIK